MSGDRERSVQDCRPCGIQCEEAASLLAIDPTAQHRRLRAIAASATLLTTAALVVSLCWMQYRSEEAVASSILSRARAHVSQFEATREYVSRFGGIYAPASPFARPNPMLPGSAAQPASLTVGGREYVLQNSPLVAHQVAELVASKNRADPIVLRMVQHTPLDPGNKPDAVDRRALRALIGGAREYSEYVRDGETTHFRYAYPIRGEARCVRCHEELKGDPDVVFAATTVDIDVTHALAEIRRGRLTTLALSVYVILGGLAALAFLILRVLSQLHKAQSGLLKLARTDALTCLPNRRMGLERFATELVRAQREGEPLACVVFDLDNFKQVNDRFGHSVGDAALRAAGEGLRENARCYDLVARTGGEEFLAVLPNVTVQEAVAIVERMRQGVYGVSATACPEGAITTSAGIAMSEPGWIETVDELMARADQALYEAKRLGRDTLHLAPALSAAAAEARADVPTGASEDAGAGA